MNKIRKVGANRAAVPVNRVALGANRLFTKKLAVTPGPATAV
jgi:hypothetical protein